MDGRSPICGSQSRWFLGGSFEDSIKVIHLCGIVKWGTAAIIQKQVRFGRTRVLSAEPGGIILEAMAVGY